MKICVRAEWSPEWRPSRNGELAEIASSSGITGAQPVADPDRPLGPVHPHVHVQAEGVVAPGHVLERVLHAPVVLGVDDLLLLPGAPRVRARGAEQRVMARGEREQARARLALPGHRVREVVAAARADLDLGLDQLAGHGLGQDRVVLRRRAQLLEALVERERAADRGSRTPPRARP